MRCGVPLRECARRRNPATARRLRSRMDNPGWLRFWFEPWHWAAPPWRDSLPMRWPASPFAQRTCYMAWCRCFALAPCWDAMPEPRALALLRAPPDALRDAASAIGYALRDVVRFDTIDACGASTSGAFAILCASGTQGGRRATSRDDIPSPPLARRALGYVAARPLRLAVTTTAVTPPRDTTALGLATLATLVRYIAPDALTRIEMMLPPGAQPASWLDCATAADRMQLLRIWHGVLRAQTADTDTGRAVDRAFGRGASETADITGASGATHPTGDVQ
jgi:hypothetical protein